MNALWRVLFFSQEIMLHQYLIPNIYYFLLEQLWNLSLPKHYKCDHAFGEYKGFRFLM